MELENVLLIGGSGFVGGWIASCLSQRGIGVTIATRHRANRKFKDSTQILMILIRQNAPHSKSLLPP